MIELCLTSDIVDDSARERERCDNEMLSSYFMYVGMKKEGRIAYDDAEMAACERYVLENNLLDDE
jgi:hypothetical protein